FQAPACMSAGMSAHLDHAAHPVSLQATGCAAAGHAGMGTLAGGLGGAAMVAAHVIATLGAALAVAGFDRAVWWLAAWLRPLLGPRVVPSIPVWARVPVPVELLSWPRQAWRRTVSLRGPPAGEPAVPTAF